jgi:hypothetical protein
MGLKMSQELTSFIPANLTVAKAKKGILIHLTLLHCAGEVDSTKIISLPLSEKGKQDLELFMTIIDDVANLMMEHQDESSDFIAKEIIKKHSFDYKKIYEMINKFAICDNGSDGFAEPFEYFVEFHDGTSQVISTEAKQIESNF